MSVPERRVVAVRPVEVAGHIHIAAVKLDDDTIQDAETVIAAIKNHEAHYTMIPPPGAPAYQAHIETGLPLELQTRPCPDCTAETLFA